MPQHTPILTTQTPARAPIRLSRRNRQHRPAWILAGTTVALVLSGWLLI